MTLILCRGAEAVFSCRQRSAFYPCPYVMYAWGLTVSSSFVARMEWFKVKGSIGNCLKKNCAGSSSKRANISCGFPFAYGSRLIYWPVAQRISKQQQQKKQDQTRTIRDGSKDVQLVGYIHIYLEILAASENHHRIDTITAVTIQYKT